MKLEDSRVFITGATGFIGGRIAERLWLEYHVRARCLVQNSSHAVRLARLPVILCPGNVLDSESLDKGIGNSDVIFHCAYGSTADQQLNSRINEEGLRNLGEFALMRGTKRFIHMSSAAVYGANLPEVVTEGTPVSYSADEYGNSKIRAEAICHELSAQGLPVVIIRPTIVFGPFSPIWTIGVMKRVLSGGWEFSTPVQGLCNPVYIDDLVNGLFLCVENDASIAETFILSGPEAILWDDFFNSYKKLINFGEMQHYLDRRKINVANSFAGTFSRLTVRWLRKFMEPRMVDMYEWMKIAHPKMAYNISAILHATVDENEKARFNQRSLFSIEKAKKYLGYSPRSFEAGMKSTASWLNYYEYVPKP